MAGLFDYFRQIVTPQPRQTVPPPQLQVRRAPAPAATAQPTPIQPSIVQPQSAQSAAIAARYGTKYAGYEDLITTRPGGGYDLRAADAAIAADLRRQEVESLSGYGLTRYQFQRAGEAKRQAAAEIQAARGNIMRQQALLPQYQAATEREWQLGLKLERGWLRGEIPPTGPTPPRVGRSVLQVRGEMPSGVLPPAMTPITAIPKEEFRQPSGGFDLFGSWAGINRRVADITGLSRLPKIPESITKGWGVVYRAAIAPTPLGLGLIAAEGLTRKPSLVIEAQKEYFPELYRGVREQPVTMAAWAGVGLITGAAAESRTIIKLAPQVPRLAKGIQIQGRVLTGLYAGASGYRVITSPTPGRELAKITATEITPLFLGAAAYQPLKRGVVSAGTKAYQEGMWFKEYTVPKTGERLRFRASIFKESVGGRIERFTGTGERLTIGPERPVIGLEKMTIARDINERVTFLKDIAPSPARISGTVKSGTGGQVLLSKVVQAETPVSAALSGQKIESLATYRMGSFAPFRRPVRLLIEEETAYSVFGVTSPFISEAPRQFSITGVKQVKNIFSSLSIIAGQRQGQLQMQLETTKIALGQLPKSATKSEMRLANLVIPSLTQKPSQVTIPVITTILTPKLDVPVVPKLTTVNIPKFDVPVIPRLVEAPPAVPVIRFGRSFDPFGHGGGGKRRPLGAFGYRKWQAVLMPSKALSFKVKGFDFAFGGKPRKGAKKLKRIRL